MKLLAILTVCWALIISNAVAQTADSTMNNNQSALAVYHSLLKPETGLYKGSEYLDYSHSIQEGSPFFDIVPFDSGSVVYHNILYSHVLIAYDVVKEEVIIYDEPRLHMISLIKNDVSCFTSSGYSFVHIRKDSAVAAHIRSGFYRVLYDGNSKMLKKEARSVQERIPFHGTVERYIIKSADYFIVRNGVYHSVNSKAALLSVLKDEGKEMQSFIRKRKLKFRKDRDADFAKAVAYYDSLKQ